MDFMSQLEGEYSKSKSEEIVQFIGGDINRFDQLFEIFVNGTYRISQRAAQPISMAVKKHSEFLLPHYAEIIALLRKSSVHDAVKRNIFRMLQTQVVPEEFEGEILDLAFDHLTDNKQAIAIRVFAMQVVYNLSAKYPEIKEELRIILEDMLPYGSAGIKSRARKILSRLDKA